MNDQVDPQGVQINTDEVKQTGQVHYPALAERFAEAAKHVSEASTAAGSGGGMTGSRIAESWGGLNGLAYLFLTTSESQLRACGDFLVRLAEDHAFTDENNKKRIENAYNSSWEAGGK